MYKKIRPAAIDIETLHVPQSPMQTEMKRRSNRGQGLVEYGLIIGLIAIVVITVFIGLKSVVDLGREGSGTLSDEGMGRNQASLSAGLYD
jgi:hypothetical protein